MLLLFFFSSSIITGILHPSGYPHLKNVPWKQFCLKPSMGMALIRRKLGSIRKNYIAPKSIKNLSAPLQNSKLQLSKVYPSCLFGERETKSSFPIKSKGGNYTKHRIKVQPHTNCNCFLIRTCMEATIKDGSSFLSFKL